jgi:TPR repeat protein
VVRGDYASAVAIVHPLADQGNAQAQRMLGELYENGRGVARDPFFAYLWYSLAARGGSPTASAGRSRVSRLLQPAQLKQADKLVENRARDGG